MQNICLICGNLLKSPIFKNNVNESNWEICNCCLFQFGVDELEYQKSYVEVRKLWILNKCKNYDKNFSHLWDLNSCLKQLENLKKVDISLYPQWVQDINTDWTDDIDEEFIKNNFL